MAIFSRRTLQRLINENAKFIKNNEAKKHINALNVDKKNYLKLLEEGKNINALIEVYLNTEWEITVLNSLSISSDVKHEEKIGVSKPDIFYTSKKYDFKFLGDITCITGKQDKDNMNEGRLFSEAKIEKGDDEVDDDWLVFKFGEPDAAVSPFKMPDSYK